MGSGERHDERRQQPNAATRRSCDHWRQRYENGTLSDWDNTRSGRYEDHHPARESSCRRRQPRPNAAREQWLTRSKSRGAKRNARGSGGAVFSFDQGDAHLNRLDSNSRHQATQTDWLEYDLWPPPQVDFVFLQHTPIVRHGIASLGSSATVSSTGGRLRETPPPPASKSCSTADHSWSARSRDDSGRNGTPGADGKTKVTSYGGEGKRSTATQRRETAAVGEGFSRREYCTGSEDAPRRPGRIRARPERSPPLMRSRVPYHRRPHSRHET